MNSSLGRIKDEIQPDILNVIILHKHEFWLNILTPKSEGFLVISTSTMQRMRPNIPIYAKNLKSTQPKIIFLLNTPKKFSLKS